MDEKLQLDVKLSKRLSRTWETFFGRFGRLTEVQRAAIPYILDGEDVLVSSATASGKTEAVAAPLVERYYGIAGKWTILYISPTRALVNDLYERLYSQITGLSLSIARRTGEHKDSVKSISNILITTPESFDSLLCRGKIDDPATGHMLSKVVAVVLDEIHLLYGTPRGEQIKWMLQRLKKIKDYSVSQGWCKTSRFQIVGLSATVAYPDEIINDFMPGGRQVIIPGTRELICMNPSQNGKLGEVLVPFLIENKNYAKILVFCNNRHGADDAGHIFKHDLEGLGYEVVVHHGSLSKSVRENAEEKMKGTGRTIAFATSTLEIGIDIGNIDLVALDGPAPDIPALLQRIGRGNRRTNETRILLCSDKQSDEMLNKAMFEYAQSGKVISSHYGKNYCVIMQQIASYIFQSSNLYRSRESIVDLLLKNLDEEIANGAMASLLEMQHIVGSKRGFQLGDAWLDASTTGQIHSNIVSSVGYEIVNEWTGEKIASNLRDYKGVNLGVGGQKLKVTGVKDHTIEVLNTSNASGLDGKWSYQSDAPFYDISRNLALKEYLAVPNNEWVIIQDNDNSIVFHFGDTIQKTAITILADISGMNKQVKYINELFFVIINDKGNKPGWIEDLDSNSIEEYITEHIDSIEKMLRRPATNKSMTVPLRVREALSWIQYDKSIRTFKETSWVLCKDEKQRRMLMKFYADYTDKKKKRH